MRFAVASTILDKALSASATAVGDPVTGVSYANALSCIIRCIAPAGSSDCKTHDRQYRAIRAHAIRALNGFSDFLRSSTALEYCCTEALSSVFGALLGFLRSNGKKAADLISPKLIQAMISYGEAYYTKNSSYSEWQQWFQELKCTLDKPQRVRRRVRVPWRSGHSSSVPLAHLDPCSGHCCRRVFIHEGKQSSSRLPGSGRRGHADERARYN